MQVPEGACQVRPAEALAKTFLKERERAALAGQEVGGLKIVIFCLSDAGSG